MQSIIDSLITDKTPLGKDGSIYQGGGAFQRQLDAALRYKNEQLRSAEEALANPQSAVEAKPVGEQESAINRGGFGQGGLFGIKQSNPYAIRTDVQKHYDLAKEGKKPTAEETDIGDEEKKKKKTDWSSIVESLKDLGPDKVTPGGFVSATAGVGGQLGTGYNPFKLY